MHRFVETCKNIRVMVFEVFELLIFFGLLVALVAFEWHNLVHLFR